MLQKQLLVNRNALTALGSGLFRHNESNTYFVTADNLDMTRVVSRPDMCVAFSKLCLWKLSRISGKANRNVVTTDIPAVVVREVAA